MIPEVGACPSALDVGPGPVPDLWSPGCLVTG
jgi:hypothetical protein